VHSHWCADLKADFTKPTSPTIGVEFTNSSVTSGGDGSDVQPSWETMRGSNPHITYHGNKRGYIACTATATSLKADFRVVDRVTVPDQPARTARAMVVEAGRSGSVTS
jgi:alkaline phosphatase D